MSDLPASIHISEEGPREGFQFEKGAIPTERKVALIDALSQTGLDHIQIVSFVNPKNVPGMADADEVVDSIAPQAGSPIPRSGSTKKALSAPSSTSGSPTPARSSSAPRKSF